MKLCYRVKLGAKAKLAGIPEVVNLALTRGIIDKLSDTNAEVLARCTTGYDLELTEVQDESLTLFDLTHKVIQQKLKREARTRKHVEGFLKDVFDADAKELIVERGLGETKSFERREMWCGVKIPWDSYESNWKLKKEFIEEAIKQAEEVHLGRLQEKERLGAERKLEDERREAQREEFLIRHLDDLDQERRKEGLLSDSEARGILMDWATWKLWGFTKDSEAAKYFITVDDAEERLALTGWGCDHDRRIRDSQETQSLSRDEYKDFLRLKKSIEEVNEWAKGEIEISVEARRVDLGCLVTGCKVKFGPVAGIRLTLSVGDWTISKIFVFRSYF